MREEPILCPHCEEPTQPNTRSDGSRVCSCTAARELPRPAVAPIRLQPRPR